MTNLGLQARQVRLPWQSAALAPERELPGTNDNGFDMKLTHPPPLVSSNAVFGVPRRVVCTPPPGCVVSRVINDASTIVLICVRGSAVFASKSRNRNFQVYDLPQNIRSGGLTQSISTQGLLVAKRPAPGTSLNVIVVLEATPGMCDSDQNATFTIHMTPSMTVGECRVRPPIPRSPSPPAPRTHTHTHAHLPPRPPIP